MKKGRYLIVLSGIILIFFLNTSRVYQIEGEVTRRKIGITDDFEQAGEKYRSFSKMDQEHLVDNLVADLMHIDKAIQQRVIDNLTKADPALGQSVAEGLNH